MAAEKETLSDLQMCMYIVVISHQLNEFVGNTCQVTNIPYPGWHSPFSWHCWLQHAFTKFKVRTIMWKFVCGSMHIQSKDTCEEKRIILFHEV